MSYKQNKGQIIKKVKKMKIKKIFKDSKKL